MAGHPLRIGLKPGAQDITPEELRAVWRIADDAGFDHLWDYDHFQSFGPGGLALPIYEGWTLLAAMAEATRRVRIGCLVTGNTYRHPAVLAKMAVTVDHLSGGRLEFGVGAAWAQHEHESLGIEGLEHRVSRLSESLRVMTALWTEDRATFEGRWFRLRDAIAEPKPVQRPHPPIWIGGGGGPRMQRLIARHADVWTAGYLAGEETIEGVAAACAEVGRDPADLRRASECQWNGQSRDELVEVCGRTHARGFTELVITLYRSNAAEMACMAAEALPELRRLQR